ncbi:hypothetical protein ASG52_24685 [Methylobacterium sp. Leaf456]|nr:hypothetical protein ASG52_24685 [Methylobacterium sp. Leaf456]
MEAECSEDGADLLLGTGFRDEVGTRREASPLTRMAPGADDDAAIRPALGAGFGKITPVNQSRHSDICIEQTDAFDAFELRQSFGGVAGFDHIESEFFEHIRCSDAEDGLIFGEYGNGASICHLMGMVGNVCGCLRLREK